MSQDRIRIGRHESNNLEAADSEARNGIKINALQVTGTDGNSSKGVRFPLALPKNPNKNPQNDPVGIGQDRTNSALAVTVRLGKGYVALIDAADLPLIRSRKWRTRTDVDGRVYATARGLPAIAMHRFIVGAMLGQVVDHRSGDTLDNRRDNLRICTNRQNVCNSKKYSSGSTSRFKGVTRKGDTGRWRAHIYANYKTIYLGTFTDEAEAARSYDNAARSLFGEFARPNFPEVTR